MRLIDHQYLKTPDYGYRRMTDMLHRKGYEVNRKRIQRLMQVMGIQAIYPRPKTSTSHPNHKIWPYLLRNKVVKQPDQVWCTDITYIPMPTGYMYLVAVMDWFSRFVLAWKLSNSMDTAFCLEALDQAYSFGKPFIFNSDQGSQFTSNAFTQRLLNKGVLISMDGRGRCFDNIFIERLWRSVKYEEIYLRKHETVPSLTTGLKRYFHHYCFERPHQSMAYCTPAEIYFGLKGLDRPIYI
jgi:putative transposase